MTASLIARTALPVLALIVLIAVAKVIAQSTPEASRGKRGEAPLLTVETITLIPQDVALTVPSYGRVAARSRAQLYPLVTGQILELSPSFKAGAFVEKGDWLLTLDDAEYTVLVQQAKRSLANAQLALAEEEARSEQARRDWSKEKTGTPTDYALRKPQLNAARVGLESARVELEQARLNLQRTKIRSPFTGRLQAVYVDLGAVVNPNIKLAEGYVTDAVEVRLPISSRDLQYLSLPEVQGPEAVTEKTHLPEVRFTNPLTRPSEVWTGQVVRTEAAVDERTQQLFVVARIEDPFSEQRDNPRRPLKIGQYIEAEIAGTSLNDALVIPNSSLYQGSYVYVVEEATQSEGSEAGSVSVLSRRDVDILWQDESQSIVGEGLAPGDRLVVTLLGQVTSGTRVSALPVDAGDDS